jgi:hypothetical protein
METRIISFFTKNRKGSTLFFTAPLLVALVSFISFVVYDVYQEIEAEAGFEPPRGIETEIDEECYEYYCWFA